MSRLGPHIGYHDSHAVAAYRVLENVGQLALPELDKGVFLGFGHADDCLFEEGERLVYVLSFFLGDAHGLGLVEALRAGQVDEVEF